jgi:hypothetical protein
MQPQVLTTLAIYVAIAVMLTVRYTRPMRMTISRMWVGPVIFLAITGFAIWGEQQDPRMAMSAATIALSLGLGAILGIPLGILRGMHTTVRATDRPGVMFLGPSWIVAVVWLGAFVIRAALRIAFMGTPFAAPLGDGLLALAISMLVTSYYVIYRKYLGLEHAAGQI